MGNEQHEDIDWNAIREACEEAGFFDANGTLTNVGKDHLEGALERKVSAEELFSLEDLQRKSLSEREGEGGEDASGEPSWIQNQREDLEKEKRAMEKQNELAHRRRQAGNDAYDEAIRRNLSDKNAQEAKERALRQFDQNNSPRPERKR